MAIHLKTSQPQQSIVVALNAGLGNQLFQFAAGLRLARQSGARLVLDATWFRMQRYRPRRECLLFHIFGSAEARNFSLKTAAIIVGRSRPSLLEKVFRNSGEIWIERDGHLPDPRFLRDPENDILLYGSWQTVDHFTAVRDILVNREFEFAPSAGYLSWLGRIQSGPSAFIHVRRGDFLTIGHGVLTPAFYQAAAREMEERMPGVQWYVFSEDEAWCRTHLGFLAGAQFVRFESPHAEIEEMYLMKHCGGGVIANSSFSWWGAALGDRPGRPIIASRHRHGRDDGDVQRHRVLSDWILLEEF